MTDQPAPDQNPTSSGSGTAPTADGSSTLIDLNEEATIRKVFPDVDPTAAARDDGRAAAVDLQEVRFDWAYVSFARTGSQTWSVIASSKEGEVHEMKVRCRAKTFEGAYRRFMAITKENIELELPLDP